MKAIVAPCALVFGLLLIVSPPALARQQRILLTPAQTRFYHACLTADWVEGYCRAHAWGIFDTYDRTEAECVAAEHGGKYPVNNRPALENTEGYCWAQAHNLIR
jgi:hypothetical protein